MVHGLVRGQTGQLVPRVFVAMARSGKKAKRLGLVSKFAIYHTGLFRFKLTFRSRLALGCCETCAETSTKLKVRQRSIEWFERDVFHSNARLSAVKVWDVIENRACIAT